jgi:hypothetical protein
LERRTLKRTTAWAASAPQLQEVSGKYLDNCAIAEP